jgi:hypothetical protein
VTTIQPTLAERLDRAVDDVLIGVPPAVAAATAGLDAPDRPLVATAATLRSSLGASLVAPRFEARLGARLSGAAGPWILRHPGRLIVTGAVGSAVGVGVTAYAVWRSTRRSSAGAHRLLHR